MKRLLASVAVLAIAAIGVSVATATSASAGGGNSANAHLCQNGGWQTLVRADYTPFTSEGACVSYGAQGGTPTPKSAAQLVCESFGGIFGKTNLTPGSFSLVLWTCNDLNPTGGPALQTRILQVYSSGPVLCADTQYFYSVTPTDITCGILAS